MIKAIFFDFDGTLVDSQPAISQAFSKTISEEMGVTDYTLPTHLIGKTFAEMFTHDFKDLSEDQITKCIATYRKNYSKDGYKTHKIYPEVENVLKILMEKYPLYISSLKLESVLLKVVEALSMQTYFKGVHGTLVQGEHKAETLSRILDVIQLKPEECILVGDSSSDYEAAERLEMDFIYASYGYGKLESCKKVISSFGEVLKFI